MGTEAQSVLIERAKAKGGFESYAALARHVGVAAPTLQQWRNGDVPLSETRLEQFCKMAGEDPGIWAMIFLAERTNVTSLRESITKILGSLPDRAGRAGMHIMSAVTRWGRRLREAIQPARSVDYAS